MPGSSGVFKLIVGKELVPRIRIEENENQAQKTEEIQERKNLTSSVR